MRIEENLSTTVVPQGVMGVRTSDRAEGGELSQGTGCEIDDAPNVDVKPLTPFSRNPENCFSRINPTCDVIVEFLCNSICEKGPTTSGK